MARYRRKPGFVDAEQFHWHGESPAALPRGVYSRVVAGVPHFYCVTIHGQETEVVDGDYIVLEPDGIHHYPCKPDIFEERYEGPFP